MATPSSKDELAAMQAAGAAFDFVFFPDCGSFVEPPTASCLSQWAVAPFRDGDLLFHSAEQAMMHGKAVLFGDLETAAKILACRTPYQAKNLGRQVFGFSETVWEEHRLEVVVAANLPKFAGIPSLREFLLASGDAILVEASSTDLVWGNGLDEFDRDARNPARWPGLNLLGFALMEVRRILAEEAISGHRA